MVYISILLFTYLCTIMYFNDLKIFEKLLKKKHNYLNEFLIENVSNLYHFEIFDFNLKFTCSFLMNFAQCNKYFIIYIFVKKFNKINYFLINKNIFLINLFYMDNNF